MPTHNVNLTDRLSAFVDAQVRSGRHQNASEVVREALRRYEAALTAEAGVAEAIRAVAREVFASGALAGPVRPEVVEAVIARLTRTMPTGSRP